MEGKLERELQKEKDAEEQKFEKRKAKMMKELKSQFEQNLKERENLTKDQKDKLMREHLESMNQLEKALAKEKERQYKLMREKLILKRLELEKEKEGRRIDNRVNKTVQAKEEEQKQEEKSKNKGRKPNKDDVMSKIAELVESRMVDNASSEFSVIPKVKGMNINVLLKGFKDALTERAEEEGKFDPIIYTRYDIDGDFDFDMMGSDDLESRNNETVNLNKNQLETESSRLLKRIV
jgi:hypothetical protein